MSEDTCFFVGMGIVTILVLVFIGLVIGESIESQEQIELGNAICEQEYNLTYDYYKNHTLHCKVPKQLENYGGIKINIGG